MTKSPYAVPLRPDYGAVSDNGSRFQTTMIRAVIAQARGGQGGNALSVAKSLWPDDRSVQDWLAKGAVTPLATSTSGAPVSTIVPIVPYLGPASAIGGLFKRCLNLFFGNAAVISIPEITASGASVAFISQGSGFPVRQLTMSPTTMTLKKASMGLTLTRELYEHSNAETILRSVIAADASLGLETLLFDATAASTTRPAGLKNGISAIAADADTGVTGMFNDLANLAAAVSVVGATNIAFVASPKQFVKIQLRKSQNAFPYPIFCSSALPDAQVCAIALDALAVAGSTDEPRFEVSNAATLVMNDVGAEMVTAGGVVASPIQSLYQADLIGLRIVIDPLNWVLRSSSGFAWIAAVNW